jgi:ribulose 1,5-bisphosphate carboxylase large subunit-like protein
MLDFQESQDFATDELDQREREMVAAMAPPRPDVDHTHAANLVQQFFASSLDANDDDERMTNHGYVVRTSTERINDIETRINRIEEMLRSWTGGR